MIALAGAGAAHVEKKATADPQAEPPVYSPAARERLAGAWRLDPQRSEDARAKMRAQRERQRGATEGRGGGRGEGGPGGGFGGRGGPGGPRGSGRGGRSMGGGGEGTNPEAMRQALDDLLEAPESMAVTLGESEVEILAKDGRARRLRPDDRKVKRESPPSETRAKWDGDKLVNETWLGDGMMHVVETWTVDAQTRELTSTLRIENTRFGGDPITVKRVYVSEVPDA
jgi:hypothetical protein